MAKYLVCDAGGTKSDFLLFDEDGRALARSRSGGANAAFCGIEASAAHVADGIDACLRLARLPGAQLAGIFLFIPGFGPSLPLLRQRCAAPIHWEGDEKSAFYGALGGPCGIAVLCGTGSFVAGQCRGGALITAGGWGPLFGDAGSGYHIGILCLRRLALLQDRGHGGSRLEQRVLPLLQADSMLAVRRDACQPGYSRAAIASLCRAVSDAAAENDADAQDILRQAALSLHDDLQSVYQRLGQPELPVALTGGAAKSGGVYVETFRRMLRQDFPRLHWQPARYEPVTGAALCVLYETLHRNIEDEELLRQLTITEGK